MLHHRTCYPNRSPQPNQMSCKKTCVEESCDENRSKKGGLMWEAAGPPKEPRNDAIFRTIYKRSNLCSPPASDAVTWGPQAGLPRSPSPCQKEGRGRRVPPPDPRLNACHPNCGGQEITGERRYLLKRHQTASEQG